MHKAPAPHVRNEPTDTASTPLYHGSGRLSRLKLKMYKKDIHMKKLIVLTVCALLLTGCGLDPADIAGVWENSAATLTFGEDGTYEIKYADPAPGDLSSENGEFQLSGGKIRLEIRDKYTVNELGEVKFERLIRTQDRKLKITLDGDALTLDGEEYTRRDEG